MTRSILAAVAASIAVAVVSGTGCNATGVGDPCTPEQEYDDKFLGFDPHEVNTESKSFQCQTRLCLVNHFQGRVSCPYGQGLNGGAVSGAQPWPGPNGPVVNTVSNVGAGCATPVDQAVTGPLITDATGKLVPADPKNQMTILGQCVERSADRAVYCSCRCANLQGATNDGANYCTCPDGFTCTQLVTSIGMGNTGLTGAYCVKNGTQFDPNGTCTTCNAQLKNCGSAPNQGI